MKRHLKFAKPPDNDEPHDDVNNDQKDKKKSQATKMIEHAKAALDLFHNREGEAFATTKIMPTQTFSLRSKVGRQYLARLYFQAEETGLGSEALQVAINTLEGQALFDGDMHPVHVRVAEDGGTTFLDLGGTDYRAIKIDAAGWEIIDNCPVKFRRSRGMLPLPHPVRGGNIAELKTFINVGSEDNWRLIVAWILAGLQARGPYPILCLTGEQGSAKSAATRILRSLIDPSSAPLRTRPRDERDLMIMANNSWVLAFDNLSDLPDWFSDACCRLATGGGLSTRELYSNADEQLFDAQRPIIMNGIEEIITRGDLVERAELIQLPSIAEDKRQTEGRFFAEFERIRPRIVGALLDVVVVGLRNRSKVRLPRLPRMADFATWIEACAPALGWRTGQASDFLDAYLGNIVEANELALDTSPITAPLRKFIDQRSVWSGPAGELLDELNKTTDEKTTRSRDWPKRPNSLSGKLRRLAPNLRKIGVLIEFDRGPAPKRQRIIRVKVAPTSSTSSTSSTSGEKAREQPMDDHPGPEAADRPWDDPVDDAWQCDNPANYAEMDGMDGMDDPYATFSKGDAWEG